MKHRNREIDIFNMSALDLFACALGAFILIAIIFLPYFPNTGDSPERVAKIQAELQAKDEALKNEQNKNKALNAELKRVQFPHLDLVVALDVTGSMGRQVDGLKQEIGKLTKILERLAPSVAVGIIAFGDREWERPLYVFNLREISGNRSNQSALRTYITRVRTNMGLGRGENEDNPEAIGAALRAAVAMHWRPKAERKMVIIITDNPAYPEERRAVLDLARNFVAAGDGRAISTVYVFSPDQDADGRAYLASLARAGDGNAVDAGESMTADLLLALLK